MSFGKFGARPRGMSNPIYWVGRHLQDQRRQAARARSVDKFNEKWSRLNEIYDHLANNFIEPLNGRSVSESISDKLVSLLDTVKYLRKDIAENIDDCQMSDLSKYATSLKKLALFSFKLCKDLNVYDDINDASYDAIEKSVFLNGKRIYFLG